MHPKVVNGTGEDAIRLIIQNEIVVRDAEGSQNKCSCTVVRKTVRKTVDITEVDKTEVGKTAVETTVVDMSVAGHWTAGHTTALGAA
jgi:hypothetical protein